MVGRRYPAPPAAKAATKTSKATKKEELETESFGHTRMTLRFDSAEQKQYIADEAKKNRRTMNDEILFRLFPATD